jgi:hypothetical protein
MLSIEAQDRSLHQSALNASKGLSWESVGALTWLAWAARHSQGD